MSEVRYRVRPIEPPRLREAGAAPGSSAEAAAAPAPPVDPSERPTVVLTGFMGTGKTETARELAGILGVGWLDTDALIEERSGMPVAQFFARHGEPRFREEEARLCAELSGRKGLVIATGGGMLLAAGNLERLGRGALVVLLEASVDAIAERVAGVDTRPLLSPAELDEHESARSAAPLAARDAPQLRGRITELLTERAAAYQRIPRRIDTSRLSPHQAACRIAAWTAGPSTRLDLALAPGREREGVSSILTGRGVLSSLGSRLREAGLSRRVFVLIAEGLRGVFETQIAAALTEADCSCEVIPIRDGDAEKNLPQVAEVFDQLAGRQASRDAVVVSVGGGVTGDLVGFAASTYMRGVPLVQVPTTLLAQVDAGIGGKVGVNHRHAKNLIGGFYLPHLVLIDPCTLRTLPARELSNGMAEVVKTALVGSPALHGFLAAHLGAPEETEEPEETDRAADAPGGARPWLRQTGFLERCVRECAAVKAAVVERDPLEAGERRVLNLGHTTAHALEAVAGYQGLTHGQAVAGGLVVALRLSERRGLADPQLLALTRRMLRRCGLPLSIAGFDGEAFARSLALDKKALSGRMRFVLPVEPGVTSVVDDVSGDDILQALREEHAMGGSEARP